MDLALIAIIVTAVVLLLQIISLALIAGMRKSIRAQKEVHTVPAAAAPQERFERRPGGDFRRHEKRPYPDQRPPRPQPQAQPAAPAPAAVDPVEKSLRDINLRLKNAERDQEFARRKLQENLTREEYPRGNDGNDRGGDRGGYNRNRDGGGGGDRGDRNRGGRDRHRGGHNRDQRRDNWQDRNRDRGPMAQQSFGSAQTAPANEQPVYEKNETVPGTQPEMQVTPKYEPIPQTPVMEQKTVAAPEIVASDYGSEGNLEHGRKVVINRSPVAESSINAPEAGQGSSSPATPMAPEEETTISNPGESSGEIIFGRRKGQ